MDYEGLETGYWTQQAQRVESLRLTINERSQVRPGRVIPEGDDVVIGSGRRLNLAVRGGPHPSDRCSSQLRWNPGS